MLLHATNRRTCVCAWWLHVHKRRHRERRWKIWTIYCISTLDDTRPACSSQQHFRRIHVWDDKKAAGVEKYILIRTHDPSIVYETECYAPPQGTNSNCLPLLPSGKATTLCQCLNKVCWVSESRRTRTRQIVDRPDRHPLHSMSCQAKLWEPFPSVQHFPPQMPRLLWANLN